MFHRFSVQLVLLRVFLVKGLFGQSEVCLGLGREKIMNDQWDVHDVV